MKTLLINNLINSSFAVKTEDGDLIFKKISEEFKQKNKVNLDFQDINLMTTAFLNAAIGQLYSDEKLYSSVFLNEYLRLKNVANEDLPLFKLVIERAKEYFKEKENFSNSINISLYGE